VLSSKFQTIFLAFLRLSIAHCNQSARDSPFSGLFSAGHFTKAEAVATLAYAVMASRNDRQFFTAFMNTATIASEQLLMVLLGVLLFIYQ
jgi:hypothetical protein